MSDEIPDSGTVCEWCGEPIAQKGTGRPRAYCSRTHREYAYRQRRERRLIARAYTAGKTEAQAWLVSSTDGSQRGSGPSVVETVPPVVETPLPAQTPAQPGGEWVRSVEEMDAQLRELEERRRRPESRA